MTVLGRVAGISGLVAGVVGAAVVGGVAAPRAVKRRVITGSDGGGQTSSGLDFDLLPVDRTYSVATTDGAVLYVEEVGPLDAGLTVIFAHGWALRLGAWHFQRMALSARSEQVRMVFYDMRSHGRSSRSPVKNPSIRDLAHDLAAVIATAAPTGPILLAGHSMGGMALLALAGQESDLFAKRVAGVALISTSASEVASEGFGRLVGHPASPVVKLAGLLATRYTGIIERGRASTREAAWLLTRSLGFARRDVPPHVVDYLDQMLTGTSVDVIADFASGLFAYQELSALPALMGIPTLVLCGDADRMTPHLKSLAIAQALPGAEFVLLANTGHVPLMETPEETNEALLRLVDRALSYAEENTVWRHRSNG